MFAWPEARSTGERGLCQGLSATLPALLLVAVIVGPFLWLSGLSFIADGQLSLANYARMLENPSYYRIAVTTFVLSGTVTVITLMLGYPTAYLISMLRGRLAGLALACVLMPFWTSLLVRTYAWMVLLQRNGVVNDFLLHLHLIERPLRLSNSFTAAVIGMVHIMLPFLVLPLYASMRSIDLTLLQAARGLGATQRQAFFQIFVPLSLPGASAGMVLVFVLCLGFYVTPQLLGGGNVTTISMKIQQNVAMYADWGAASALGVVLILSIAALPALLLVTRKLRRTAVPR